MLEPAGWPEALDVAAQRFAAARARVGVLAGGRLTVEDAYAYSKFARVALATDDVDFRARALRRGGTPCALLSSRGTSTSTEPSADEAATWYVPSGRSTPPALRPRPGPGLP